MQERYAKLSSVQVFNVLSQVVVQHPSNNSFQHFCFTHTTNHKIYNIFLRFTAIISETKDKIINDKKINSILYYKDDDDNYGGDVVVVAAAVMMIKKLWLI